MLFCQAEPTDLFGAFAWIPVHRIAQALVFLVLMVAIGRITSVDFGFGCGDRKVGFRFVRVFAFIFAAFVVVSMAILLVFGTFRAFPYPLTTRTVAGQLAFQVGYATALGIAYDICYERSKSVHYPMMMHSISNVIAVGVSAAATAIIG